MVEEVLSGYCYVGKQNIECFFTLFDYRVTLIVKDKDDLIGLRKWGETESIEEFIYGVTSQGKKLYLLEMVQQVFIWVFQMVHMKLAFILDIF